MRRTSFYLSTFMLSAICFVGCAPSHAGRTLGRGVLQAEGSLGGPFVTNLGGAIPIPNLPVGARYGLRERLDIATHVNLLPLFVGGFLAIDTSLTFGLLKQEGHKGVNLATSAGFAFLTDFENGARLSPLVDMAIGYTIARVTPFVGFEAIVDLWQSSVITDPYAGLELDLGRWTLSAAAVWFHPAHDWYASSIRYVSGSYNGAVGCLIGVKYRWPAKRGGLRP